MTSSTPYQVPWSENQVATVLPLRSQANAPHITYMGGGAGIGMVDYSTPPSTAGLPTSPSLYNNNEEARPFGINYAEPPATTEQQYANGRYGSNGFRRRNSFRSRSQSQSRYPSQSQSQRLNRGSLIIHKYSKLWFKATWDKAVEIGRWPRVLYVTVGIILMTSWIIVMLVPRL